MYKTVSRFSAQRSLSTNLHVSAIKNTLNIYHGMDIKPSPPQKKTNKTHTHMGGVGGYDRIITKATINIYN